MYDRSDTTLLQPRCRLYKIPAKVSQRGYRYIKNDIGLSPANVVADIGAGTGFLTELFLHHGNLTYAVEPNEAMRQACNHLYGADARLKIVDGSAEMTQLEDQGIDIIAAGTAFHWFDPVAAKKSLPAFLNLAAISC
ncbi:class I SAM-dependent methyltransferase [Niabella sp. W65]|nr:class I SAM-dependent methyltransferase [Niabella sp. W65]MCH7365904.1 class I SAM-dependent methyltransferase [Niabella sp. W65]